MDDEEVLVKPKLKIKYPDAKDHIDVTGRPMYGVGSVKFEPKDKTGNSIGP
jgi:hypothetical protein